MTAVDEKIEHLLATERKVSDLTMLAISERVSTYFAEHTNATLVLHPQQSATQQGNG